MTEPKPLSQDPEELQTRTRATHLLDRQAPDDYRREWTARIAAAPATALPGTASAVVFRLGSEWFALPAAVFQEVAEPAPVHVVPHRRGGNLLGLVNVRGELLLCVALSVALGVEAQSSAIGAGRTVYQRLLVVSQGGNRLAFPVDEIFGVVRYHPRELLDAPATLASAAAAYTLGLLPWNQKTVGCIDDEALFFALNRSFS